MSKAKVAITIDEGVLYQLDRLVSEAAFPNRSQAFEVALVEKLSRLAKTRLAVECAKLNKAEEVALAEEGIASELDQWPPY